MRRGAAARVRPWTAAVAVPRTRRRVCAGPAGVAVRVSVAVRARGTRRARRGSRWSIHAVAAAHAACRRPCRVRPARAHEILTQIRPCIVVPRWHCRAIMTRAVVERSRRAASLRWPAQRGSTRVRVVSAADARRRAVPCRRIRPRRAWLTVLPPCVRVRAGGTQRAAT